MAGWARDNAAVESLAAEHASFAYKPGNLPIRLLFGHFVAFCSSKVERPEFFCWPGAWMAGHRASPGAQCLLERHSAPFIDKPDDAAIYPRLMPSREESVVHEAFSSFYATNVTYDLTRQWVAQPGPFEYDYGWLAGWQRATMQHSNHSARATSTPCMAFIRMLLNCAARDYSFRRWLDVLPP